ncbi:hypothetical protein GCM10010145_63770 [Streptomyces ruber]|uniref:Uncharacterized protein n=2 Tax=Streptomyces TaxID=1883 RepID=A0A918BQ27_9ACTN|nr:hypothetical protein GCM10010145_63770 [Streptomyces ruber]
MEAHRELPVAALTGVRPAGAPRRAVRHPGASQACGWTAPYRSERACTTASTACCRRAGGPAGARGGPRRAPGSGRQAVSSTAFRAEGPVHLVEAGGDGVQAEGAARGVVDAHDDRHDVRAQGRRGGGLPVQDVVGPGAADGRGDECGAGPEPFGQEGGPAAPAALDGHAVHIRGKNAVTVATRIPVLSRRWT